MGLAGFLLAALGTGCTPRPAAVIASPDGVRVAEAPVALEAVVVDAHGAVVDVPVTWTTSDPAVVTVDGAGTLTAVRSGSATARAAVGELYDDVLVDVDLFASATLQVPVLLTEGERAPLSWSARDDAGGAWEGAVACTTSDAAVLAVAGREVVAVGPGRATVTCAAPGASLDAEVRVLPSTWDAFAWRHARSVEVAGRTLVPYSSYPTDDWVRLTESFSWRTESGGPAYVVLAELLDLSVAFSCDRGQVLVVTPGDDGLQVRHRVDLGSRCLGIPPCDGCAPERSDTLAPPRFTATGLVAGGVRYVWRDGTLVRDPI